MISHVDNINRNLARELNKMDSDEVRMRTGFTYHEVVKYSVVMPASRLGTVERFAGAFGVSVAELMLIDGVETNWYEEASIDYLGENLRRYRKELGLTQTDLAERLTDDRTVLTKMSGISCYEQGVRFPTVGVTQALADALGVEVADLFVPPEGV